MELTAHDRQHILQRLRSGVVPERGLDAFAVGIDPQRNEMARMLDLVASGEGDVKFLRGGYGCGKTFMSRLTQLDAQRQNFVTSYVVVSDNDLHFHKFNDVYRKVVAELSTQLCPRGALADLLDRWIGNVEDALIDGGEDEDAPDFDQKVKERLGEELLSKTQEKVPQDFIRVLTKIFELKQDNQVAEASALISWLSGSANVAAKAKKLAGVKGDITSSDALAYLHGILAISKAAGYRGLVIVIDEVETVLRMRKDVRGKSLNGLRQIVDGAGQYPGLLWVFTGTPEFFDTRRGVAGLQPLHDRIKHNLVGSFANHKQPQLELKPFDPLRLHRVAQYIRDLGAKETAELHQKLDDSVIDLMIAKATEGFGADVGIVPRDFLRHLVHVIDLIGQEPTFDPLTHLELQDLSSSSDSQEPLSWSDDDDADAGGYEPISLDW